MMLFFLVLLLNIPKEIIGIYCVYSEEPFEWSLYNSNSTEFELQINEIPIFDYKDDNIDMCRIEIYINYQSGEIIISFADSFQWSELDDGEGRLDFLITFDNIDSEGDYYNVLEYACYNQDQCEKLFLFNNIQWLTQVNYTIFKQNLKSLLFQNSTKTEKCYIDKINSLNCSNGICLGKYSTHKTYLFECHESSERLVEVHLTTYILIQELFLNKPIIQEQQTSRYTCKYNLCNNQFLTDSLVNIVKNDFNLQPMKDALTQLYISDDVLNYNFTDNIQYQPTSEDLLNYYLLFNKSNKFNNISRYILLLLFIIIIYFI